MLTTLEQASPAGQVGWDVPAAAKEVERLGSCGLAGAEQEGYLLAATALVVREHGKPVRGEGGRYYGAVLHSPEKALVISVDEKLAFRRWSWPPTM